MSEKSLSIHTSDRILYKRCRRKWDYSSHLRKNLEPSGSFSPHLWFGTGIHFALEDFHGYNKFKSPVNAFQAYYDCFNRETELDMDCETLATIAPGMLSYYQYEWLPLRKPFKTLWINGVPQLEVEILLDLPQISEIIGRPVHYSMRLDRVVEDDLGRLWVMDYKTAKAFDTGKLETDPQISAYCWGAELYYGREIEGMVYLQMKKTIVEDPKILKNGSVSVDKSQNTNFYRYRDMLNFKYSLEDIPEKNQECLDYLLKQESELGDTIIRYDLVRRTQFAKEKEYELIKMEILEMLNPDIPIYINPTRDCYNDCSFRPICMAQNDGYDFQFILENNYQTRKGEYETWKKKLILPQ